MLVECLICKGVQRSIVSYSLMFPCSLEKKKNQEPRLPKVVGAPSTIGMGVPEFSSFLC